MAVSLSAGVAKTTDLGEKLDLPDVVLATEEPFQPAGIEAKAVFLAGLVQGISGPKFGTILTDLQRSELFDFPTDEACVQHATNVALRASLQR